MKNSHLMTIKSRVLKATCFVLTNSYPAKKKYSPVVKCAFIDLSHVNPTRSDLQIVISSAMKKSLLAISNLVQPLLSLSKKNSKHSAIGHKKGRNRDF
jgi:hypothetical protein